MKARPYLTPAATSIAREADYITDCSYTSATTNRAHVIEGADGDGALNDIRISDNGPDWVAPETSAVGAISLMQASTFLRTQGVETGRCDMALDAYFDTWLTGRQQGWVTDAGSDQQGGMASRVYYDVNGHAEHSDGATPAATGITVAAMWKRGEYLAHLGKPDAGRAWLTRAWPTAQAAGEYLLRHGDPQTRLMRVGPTSRMEWLTDACGADDGLQCLDHWAGFLGKPDPRFRAMALQLAAGIAAMKDPGTWHNFYRVREFARGGQPGYGDSVDQICFLPYEADVLDPADPYAKQTSDWWTVGSGQFSMTPQTAQASDWRYYGTHWHHYFSPRPEDDYLYPGPGLQLAKVEWKYAMRTHDKTLARRAALRLQWAVSRQYSALWYNATGAQEAGVGNGLLDWRDAKDYRHTAAPWARFIDTSAYLIQVTLMVNYHQDTKYTPES